MRKTLIALLLTATLPTVALAMPEGGPRHGGEYGAHLFKELDLSQEQRQQVGKLMRKQMRSRHAITQRYLDKLPAAEKKAMQEELSTAKTSNEQAIRALLSPEQQKSYAAALKEMEKRRAERAEFKAWKAEKDSKAE